MVLALVVLVSSLSSILCWQFFITWIMRQKPRSANLDRLSIRKSRLDYFRGANRDNSDIEQAVKDAEEVESILKRFFWKTAAVSVLYAALIIAFWVSVVVKASWLIPMAVPQTAIYVFLGAVFFIASVLFGIFLRDLLEKY